MEEEEEEEEVVTEEEDPEDVATEEEDAEEERQERVQNAEGGSGVRPVFRHEGTASAITKTFNNAFRYVSMLSHWSRTLTFHSSVSFI